MSNQWKYFGMATWQWLVKTSPTPLCQIPKIGRLQGGKNATFQGWLLIKSSQVIHPSGCDRVRDQT